MPKPNSKKSSPQRKPYPNLRKKSGKQKKVKPIPLLNSSISPNVQLYQESRESGASSVSLAAVHWVTNFFYVLSFESSTSVAQISVDLSTVARLVDPSASRDVKGSRPTKVTVWILPPALSAASTNLVTANSAFGVLASVPMYRTPALTTDPDSGVTSVTGLEVSQLGSTSTRVQTKTSPNWIQVLDYSFSRAYSEGFAVISPRSDFPDLTTLLNMQVVSLYDGSALTDQSYQIQVRVEGDTQIPPQAAVTADLTYLNSWSDPPTITNEPLSKFAVVDYKHMTSL